MFKDNCLLVLVSFYVAKWHLLCLVRYVTFIIVILVYSLKILINDIAYGVNAVHMSLMGS